ncbi:MAG: hypothetical protein OXU74_12640 [Gemmatimonadota bacterium]|nr:hypothetical protein [Gemmatimonadota bacterium]
MAAPASSPSAFVAHGPPAAVPSTSTQYVVLAASAKPVGAVKVRLPAASVAGLVSVTTSVPADVVDTPVSSFTLTPVGAALKHTSMLVRL